VIEVENALVEDVIDALKSFENNETISAIDLAEVISEKAIDKFDEYLSQNLLTQGYAARAFDVEKTRILVKKLL